MNTNLRKLADSLVSNPNHADSGKWTADDWFAGGESVIRASFKKYGINSKNVSAFSTMVADNAPINLDRDDVCLYFEKFI